MRDHAAFNAIWNQVDEGEGPPRRIPARETTCPYAQQFAHWCRALCADLEERATVVTVNQKKVLLVDKYYEWRTVVPKAHRNRINDQGHRCLWHVFEETYLNLRALELAITPPMLFVPPKPPRQPKAIPAQAAGIFLGEMEDGHDR